MSTCVILSGGLDSSTALGLVRLNEKAEDVRAVSFDYGQRHRRELESAVAVARHYGVNYRVVNVGELISPGSALTGAGEIPEGHYAADNMAATVVHGRNLLFASIALSIAGPGSSLVLGVHAGDHPVYADCRPDFWQEFTRLAGAYDVSVRTPFLHAEKRQIAQWAAQHGVPVELTWSCYNGGSIHCGRCGTCVERAEAFYLAGVVDPTEYADPNFWRSAVMA